MPEPLNFYVFITYDNLTQNSLRIPIEFTREHQKQILSNDNIILTVSDDKNWPMGWKISNNGHLLLQKGWPEFAEHYRIKIGYLLLFNHQGSSIFRVKIFDRNSCEITYFPLTKSPSSEKEFDQSMMQTKSTVQEMEGNTEFAFKQRSRDREHKSAIPFKSDHPFYSVRVTVSYFQYSRLPVPITFSRRYLTDATKSADCVLQMPDGRKWGPIRCKDDGAQCKMTGKNWKKFSNEHLVVGDVCVFELINEIEKLLKVTIVRDSSNNSRN